MSIVVLAIENYHSFTNHINEHDSQFEVIFVVC